MNGLNKLARVVEYHDIVIDGERVLVRGRSSEETLPAILIDSACLPAGASGRCYRVRVTVEVWPTVVGVVDIRCRGCGGDGLTVQDDPQRCDVCNGSGVERITEEE